MLAPAPTFLGNRCQCHLPIHVPRLVVITGGPGAGKTAVLEVARKIFCKHVAVLPEAASILFGGGFLRRESLPARKAAQRAIFHVQRELERIVIDEKNTSIALCDRGTLDGLAYWPNSETSFFEELNITKKEELLRYSAVIHLSTPSAIMGYNHSNPMRVESAKEAAQINERTEKVWESHPKRICIDSNADFFAKTQQALEEIDKLLPNCCNPNPWIDSGEKRAQ